MKKFTYNDGDQYRPSTREWVNSTYSADYLKKHQHSSLTPWGMDDIFGDYRIFIENTSFPTNNTSKWSIALYGKKMDELARVVVGGAKNCHWAEAAKIALKWLNDIMDWYDAKIAKELPMGIINEKVNDYIDSAFDSFADREEEDASNAINTVRDWFNYYSEGTEDHFLCEMEEELGREIEGDEWSNMWSEIVRLANKRLDDEEWDEVLRTSDFHSEVIGEILATLTPCEDLINDNIEKIENALSDGDEEYLRDCLEDDIREIYNALNEIENARNCAIDKLDKYHGTSDGLEGYGIEIEDVQVGTDTYSLEDFDAYTIMDNYLYWLIDGIEDGETRGKMYDIEARLMAA